MSTTLAGRLKTKSPLSYFGSDAGVAAELARLLDPCRHVTIPFVGGGSILPHLTARAIVANDRHASAINFYRVASGFHGPRQRDELFERCRHTLSHPDEMRIASKILADEATAVESAWAFWAICWIGRKGKGGTRNQSGMPSVRRTAEGGTNASRIRAAADDLLAWAEHFERCEWEQDCFRVLLPKVAERNGCGVYCDPPWLGAGRDYLWAFTDQDHADLAELLARFNETRVVVRYGDAPLIRELYPIEHWHWTFAESRTQANAMTGEIWLTNFDPEATL